MMIFLAVVELLDGTRRFLLNKDVLSYDFVGVDSSFAFIVKKSEGHRIRLVLNCAIIDEVGEQELAQSVWDGVGSFLFGYEQHIKPSDLVAGDLQTAVRRFESDLLLAR